MTARGPDPGARDIAGIIFDMDGVLCDSEAFIAAASIEMFRETYGITVSRDSFAPYIGVGEDRFLRDFGETAGVHVTLPRDKLRTYALYQELIRGKLRPLPGALEFLADCRRAGLRLAIATSADRIKLDANLREIGVPRDTFVSLVTGEDVERKKPDPEIFLRAARDLGLPPERCLVIEDAVNGVRAAKAAGSPCLGITTSFVEAELRAAGADFVAADLATIPSEVGLLLRV